MNIFVLDHNPYEAAADHCDRHVCKMVLEYAQMLSTAQRLLDGKPVVVADPEERVKPKRFWLFPGEQPTVIKVKNKDGLVKFKWVVENARCYQVAHANHPCSVWARETDANYHWLLQLFDGTLREYAARYQKQHSATRLLEFLRTAPRNIPRRQLTPFAQAMPEEYKHDDPVEAYRRFYVGAKARFAKWRYSPVPTWYQRSMEGQNATDLT